MKELAKIEIKGGSATGKTTLAAAIRNSLKYFGIEVEVIECEDESPDVMETHWRQRIKNLHGRKVKIETIRIHNEPAR